MRLLALVLLGPVLTYAGEARLDAIHALLLPMRHGRQGSRDPPLYLGGWQAGTGRSDRHQGPFLLPYDSTRHCQQHPDLWQVNIGAGDPQSDVYFLVRWRPPYRFTMVSVSAHLWPDCIEKDPAADETRTLFPIQ
jgi:hypothetical protein